MSTGRFKSIKKADIVSNEVGYLKAWVALKDDFTTLSEPVLSSTPVIGEAYTINTDHAFTTGKEPMSVLIRVEDLEAAGETVGETGSLRTAWKPKLFIPGDGPKVEEVVSNLLNEEIILFVQEGCGTEKHYLQFGCDCRPAKVTKRGFSSGNAGGGKKGTELEMQAYCKFFYNGTLPSRA
jgi:hypothetical protein